MSTPRASRIAIRTRNIDRGWQTAAADRRQAPAPRCLPGSPAVEVDDLLEGPAGQLAVPPCRQTDRNRHADPRLLRYAEACLERFLATQLKRRVSGCDTEGSRCDHEILGGTEDRRVHHVL